jgi:hypothetical protein
MSNTLVVTLDGSFCICICIYLKKKRKNKNITLFLTLHCLSFVCSFVFSGQVVFPSSLGVCYTPIRVLLRFFLSSVLYLCLHIGDNVRFKFGGKGKTF